MGNLRTAKTAERRQRPSRGKVSPNVARSFNSGNIVANVLALQRAVGNRAVNQLIQAKLAVSRRDDSYEQEADQVAEQITQAPKQQVIPKATVTRHIQSGHVQGLCRECQENLSGRFGKKKDEEEVLQAKGGSGTTFETIPLLQAEIDTIGGSGQPLPQTTRAFFEPRLGCDFSQVRIHTDAKAAATAKALNARAFTVGHDVVLGTGEYAPETRSGQKLLAHELTHVIQQTGDGTLSHNQIPNNDNVADSISPVTEKNATTISSTQGAVVQRELIPGIPGPGSLVGDTWLALNPSLKIKFIDTAINGALIAVDNFPGKYLLGELWIFVKEGLTGFYQTLKSAAQDVKIRTIDKIARIMAGRDEAFTLAYLKGILKGFFVDGALGIFVVIWELIKGIRSLWEFFGKVGEAIGRFPEEIENLLQSFKGTGQELAAGMGTAIDEFKQFITDPKQVGSLIGTIVEKGKAFAKQGGEKIAQSLLNFFSKPEASAGIGETVGNLTGQVLWEVVFAALTAGGGAAVTAAKTGLKGALQFLARITGKITSGFIKLFEEGRTIFGVVVKWIKGSAKAVKGKLAELAERFGGLLERVKEFFSRLIQNCHESKLTCKFVKGVTEFVPKIAKKRLDHAFDRHAHEWFGRVVPRETHYEAWRELVERVSKSRKPFEWSLPDGPTIAYLGQVEGKYFLVQYYKRDGLLATAFVPDNQQLQRIFKILK